MIIENVNSDLVVSKARNVIYGVERGVIDDIVKPNGLTLRRVSFVYKKRFFKVHFYRRNGGKNWLFDHLVED